MRISRLDLSMVQEIKLILTGAIRVLGCIMPFIYGGSMLLVLVQPQQ